MVQALKSKQILIALILVAVSFSVGRFTGPAKVEVREVEKVVYQEKTKKDVERTVERNTRETVLPDGTIIRETLQSRNTKSKTDTDKNVTQETSKESVTTNRPTWRAGFGFNPEIPGYQEPIYSIRLERQVLSELYVGVSLDSKKQAGLTISIGF
jgi:hypothetical protein